MPVTWLVFDFAQRVAGDLVEHNTQRGDAQNLPQDQVRQGNQQEGAADDAQQRAWQQETHETRIPLAPVKTHGENVTDDEQGHGNAHRAGDAHALCEQGQYDGTGHWPADATLDQSDQDGCEKYDGLEFHCPSCSLAAQYSRAAPPAVLASAEAA